MATKKARCVRSRQPAQGRLAARVPVLFHTKQKKKKFAPPKTTKPDVVVRRSSYSKAARLSVLASANARQQLIEMGGENTIDVIREFDRDMSDEEIAKKTGIRASDVRVVLNRLHNYGLFSYTRVRDRDSGWYSYIWKMSEGRLGDFAKTFENRAEAGDVGELVEGPSEYVVPAIPKTLGGFPKPALRRR